jgi:tRNA pseudouridine38-40 synthase
MRTIKLTLAYDGSAYCGWQTQSKEPTLQLALERALERVTGQSLGVAASGRTDAGVHALGQVVSFDTDSHLPADVFLRALNAELPRDMVVVASEEATSGFHARRDARRKRYRYVIGDGPTANVFQRHYAWQLPTRLNDKAMRRAAQALVGRHDFSSFETRGSPRASNVRTIFDLEAARNPVDADQLHIEVEADGFLYNMVRAIVGTLIEVGRGVKDEDWPAAVLAARHRRAAGQTAPAQGLFLLWVKYGRPAEA